MFYPSDDESPTNTQLYFRVRIVIGVLSFVCISIFGKDCSRGTSLMCISIFEWCGEETLTRFLFFLLFRLSFFFGSSKGNFDWCPFGIFHLFVVGVCARKRDFSPSLALFCFPLALFCFPLPAVLSLLADINFDEQISTTAVETALV